ncbi:hypothetical protein [Gordonia sp. KTR9]|uniref:hypothetical protein n=1 Tax=Gordonia sp. KTR9 TaxID=337191 RepID=UPI00027DE51F|nr:hypothetical protein [Gordonia sp. KTR9]AFR50891.1 hypothetical protein KTR9_4284 [Gordonia sp. KTR9]
MSRRRGTGRGAVRRRRGLVLVLALAVMLMHTVVSGHSGSPASSASAAGHSQAGPSGGDSGMSHHAGHSAHSGSSTMSAAPELTGPEMTDTDDCGEHSHDCVFIRAAGVDLPAVVLVLLVWSLAALPRIADIARRRTTVLGRPPPWAIYSHLQLQVIRC